MANKQFFVPLGGPGGNALLRIALIETDQAGVFQISFEEVSIDATYPSLAASITSGTSKVAGSSSTPIVSTAADTETLNANDSGRVTIGTKASATQVFTLPAAQVAGLVYTFVCGNAAGEILVTPVGTDIFAIKATVDQGASVVTAAGVGIKNTAATNVRGDLMTVISNGLGTWTMLGQSGIWATQ